MKIWLDTIDLNAVEMAASKGIIAGVTTNPSILSQSGNIPEILRSLLKLQSGPVAVQVTSHDPMEIIEEARKLHSFSERIVVKIPVTSHGLVAMNLLQKDQIPLLGTGVLSPAQALLVANHNPAYIAPYLSRIGDIKQAFDILETIITLFRCNHYTTKILVASVKDVSQIVRSAALGVDAITIKEHLLKELLAEPPALEVISQQFAYDWSTAYGGLSLQDLLT